ncbi:MAG: helix-turn-helix domain-containing protein [Anaerolineae bacterium]
MFQSKDHILISNLEQLKAISDPLRLKLFEEIRTANQQGELQTIRKAAETLQTSHAKLYYHVKQLEKHEFIYVADTVMISGIAEKYYAVVAEVIIVDPALLEGQPAEEAAVVVQSMLRTTFDVTVSEISQLMKTDPTGDQHIHLNRQLLRLTEDQALMFHEKLSALEEEIRLASQAIEADEGKIYSLMTVFTPTVRNQLGEGER